jgi:hypothetical protein
MQFRIALLVTGLQADNDSDREELSKLNGKFEAI